MDFELSYDHKNTKDSHPTLRSLALAFDELSSELTSLNSETYSLTLFPSEPIEDSMYLQVNCFKSKNNPDELSLSVMINKEYYEPKYYEYVPKDMEEVKEIFFNYYSYHKLPSLNFWSDETEYINNAEECIMKINIFKEAFKIHRYKGKEIYKGFGFKHLSDVTQYYVHRNNQSDTGTTSLCQSIGESVVLFSLMLSGIIKGDEKIGDYYYDNNRKYYAVKINIPEDWHISGVIDKNIKGYYAFNNDEDITFHAFAKDGSGISDKLMPLDNLYKLLPCFLVLLAKEMELNKDFSLLINNFIESPAADIFINICEDFYQNHKFEEYNLCYGDFGESLDELTSCYSTYEAIRENKNNENITLDLKINKFSSDNFLKEYLDFIPKLGSEFELQKELSGLCNAVQSGDIRAVLFHGPAGTGKTIACKLVCKEIALPIMATINCTENLDEYILGKYIPKEDKILFIESYVTKAIRDGGAVVFEEINFAKPQYLAFLNSLLDDNGFVRLDNGDIVKRHNNFRLFATMNLGYYGTKELNQALFNRFNSVIELAELSDDSIKKMLSTRIPGSIPFIEKMLGVYHKLRKKIENEELEIVISPRNLENWARLAKYEGYIRAAEKTIIPIAKSDRALEAAIKGIIYIYKWS